MRLFLLISFMVLLFSSPCFAEDTPALHTSPMTPDIVDESAQDVKSSARSVICPFCQSDIWNGEKHKSGCCLKEPKQPKKKSLWSKTKQRVRIASKKVGRKLKNSCKAVSKKTYEAAKKVSKIVEPVEPLVRVTALTCVSTAQIAILFLN